MRLTRKERLSESFDRHDLEIEDNHNFVVEGVVVHNSNCRVGIVVGEYVAGSMEVRRKWPVKADGTDAHSEDDEVKRSTYWFPLTLKGVKDLLLSFSPSMKDSPQNMNVILYGEVYGGSIQSLDYGMPKGKGLGFRAFGLRVNGKFMDWDKFVEICKQYNVGTVPVLWRGPFSMTKAKELADGKSEMAGHMREGTVVYPITERNDPKIGRVVLKYISTEYELSKHKDEDTKDV